MFFFYNFFLILLLLVGWPLLLLDLLLKPRHRSGVWGKLGVLPLEQLKKLQGQSPIWLHGVSVGEVNSLLPMISALQNKYPGTPLLISVGTATGLSFAMRHVAETEAIIFFPWDLPFVCAKVIRQINPRLVIISEKEIWPNFLHALKKQNIPIMWINGRLSDRSLRRYKIFKAFFRQVLSGVTYFGVDSEESQRRWIDMGADAKKIFVTGHTKVDQAIDQAQKPRGELVLRMAPLLQNKKVLIAASTHEGEEKAICQTFLDYSNGKKHWQWILAPRHPERFDAVAGLLKKMGLDYFRLSELNGKVIPKEKPILLIDQIGILAQLYSIANIAFIGGTLVPIGGHNVWEAAAFGIPMIYGPFMKQDFGLAQKGGALQVKQIHEFSNQLISLLKSEAQQNQMRNHLKNFLEEHRGAVEKNIHFVEEILS